MRDFQQRDHWPIDRRQFAVLRSRRRLVLSSGEGLRHYVEPRYRRRRHLPLSADELHDILQLRMDECFHEGTVRRHRQLLPKRWRRLQQFAFRLHDRGQSRFGQRRRRMLRRRICRRVQLYHCGKHLFQRQRNCLWRGNMRRERHGPQMYGTRQCGCEGD